MPCPKKRNLVLADSSALTVTTCSLLPAKAKIPGSAGNVEHFVCRTSTQSGRKSKTSNLIQTRGPLCPERRQQTLDHTSIRAIALQVVLITDHCLTRQSDDPVRTPTTIGDQASRILKPLPLPPTHSSATLVRLPMSIHNSSLVVFLVKSHRTA